MRMLLIAVAGATLLVVADAHAFLTGNHGGRGAYTDQRGDGSRLQNAGGQEWGGGGSRWPGRTNQGGWSVRGDPGGYNGGGVGVGNHRN